MMNRVAPSGGSIRIYDDGRVTGYLVRFTSPDERDLYRTYFDENTDYAIEDYPIRGYNLLFEHAMDEALGVNAIGKFTQAEIRTEPDEDGERGIWIEAQLKRLGGYVELLRELNDEAVRRYGRGLAFSSGALPQSVEISEDGHVERWAIIEGSLTLTPGDPNNKVNFRTLSDLQRELLRESSTTKEADGNTQDVEHKGETMLQEQIAIKKLSSKGVRNMDELMQKLMEVTQKVIQEFMDEMKAERMDDEDMPEDERMSDDEEYRMDEDEIRAFVRQEVERIKPTLNAITDGSEPTEDQINRAVKAHSERLFEATAERVFKAQAEKRQRRREVIAAARGRHMVAPGKSDNVGGYVNPEPQRDAPRLQIRDVTPFDDWTPADYSFAVEVAQMSANTHRSLIPGGIINSTFMRRYADAVADAHQKGEIRLTQANVRAVNAVRANELDYSTQTGFGDEWVFTSWSEQIWDKPRLDLVYTNLNVTEMPSNPYEIPTESTDPTVFFVGETTDEDQLGRNDSNAAIPDAKIGTNRIQLNAKKHAMRVNWSAELGEDAIGNYLPKFRQQSQRAIEDALEKTILLGDTSTSGNINDDGGTPAATDNFLAYDGIVHQALVTATTNAVDASGNAPTLAHIRSIRSKLGNAQGYNPANLAIFTDFPTYMKLLSIDAVVTVDKMGSQATVMTGSLGQIDGINIFVSGQMALADADGKITNGGNTVDRGRLAMVYLPDWYVGYRRRIASYLNFLPYADAWELVLTVRTALSARSYSSAGAQQSSDDSVSLLYNIGV